MNKKIVKQFFPGAIKNIENNKCAMCGNKINKKDFRNDISLKEYKISGMCQKCQDHMFGKD